jgi:hypothetical protein
MSLYLPRGASKNWAFLAGPLRASTKNSLSWILTSAGQIALIVFFVSFSKIETTILIGFSPFFEKVQIVSGEKKHLWHLSTLLRVFQYNFGLVIIFFYIWCHICFLHMDPHMLFSHMFFTWLAHRKCLHMVPHMFFFTYVFYMARARGNVYMARAREMFYMARAQKHLHGSRTENVYMARAQEYLHGSRTGIVYMACAQEMFVKGFPI